MGQLRVLLIEIVECLFESCVEGKILMRNLLKCFGHELSVFAKFMLKYSSQSFYDPF